MLLSSCLPFIQVKKSRIFFSHSVDNLYQLSDDIENDIFKKYTVNDTIFILLTDMYELEVGADEIKEDIVCGKYLIHIFTKRKGDLTYRLLKSTIRTSSFIDDTRNLIRVNCDQIDSTTVILDTSKETIKNDGYRVATILSNYYYYPRPQDMKFSITIQVEEEDEKNIKTIYEFTYYFTLEMKDSWFRLLSRGSKRTFHRLSQLHTNCTYPSILTIPGRRAQRCHVATRKLWGKRTGPGRTGELLIFTKLLTCDTVKA
jgi:hypothetical protein